MRTPIFALAAGLIAMSASAASALPNTNKAMHGSPIAQHVDHRDNDNRNDGRHRMHHHDNDHRYDAYRGWNRYNSRPRGWRNRGCVAVGPIWFCK